MTNSDKKCVYDPLLELMTYYSKENVEKEKKVIAKDLPVEEVLKNRIIDGDKIGADRDLSIALKKYSALEIINNILLEGMKVVGELFGSGQMQLPFVLQSAECMKSCVGYLEPFMEKVEGESSKGVMVLATVKGDVHDIGKNLVDIILTNNGYRVINMGIKCPLDKMLTAFEENKANVIGMSGLLVKSTAIMKENLELMNERNIEVPVILGGAALNRRFVEGELREMYKGDIYYANDAFDGLRYMGDIMTHKKLGTKPKLEIYIDPRKSSEKYERTELKTKSVNIIKPRRSNISADVIIPEPPFWGCKIVEDIPIDKVYEYINEVALFKGSWNVYRDKNKPLEEYTDLLKREIYPKFNELKLKAKREKLLNAKVIYGYFPCQADNDNLIIYKPSKELLESSVEISGNILHDIWEGFDISNTDKLTEWVTFSFPRQKTGKYLCISDYFKSKDTGLFDVVAFQIVTVGKTATDYAQMLYNDNKYQDYLYFHGLSVETAEALAEYWHKVIRRELNIHDNDSPDMKKIFQQGYQGSRYSFGYPACPDLEDNLKLFELLRPERIGITLSEEWQMVPEQSTNAIIVHHPEAKYFFIK